MTPELPHSHLDDLDARRNAYDRFAAQAAGPFDSLDARVADIGIPLHERVEALPDAAERLRSPAAFQGRSVVAHHAGETRPAR